MRYWYNLGVESDSSELDKIDMFTDVEFKDCKPFPTCGTCDIKHDCKLELRKGEVWGMTKFCSLHQDFGYGKKQEEVK